MLPPNSYTGECIHIPIALCIQAYNQCNPEKKKGLIAKYKAEGGIKNLAWVTNYVEKAKDLEVTETKITRGYFYASEILRMNGFQQGTLDQKTEQKVLEGLLADCYQEFQVDPSNPPHELKQENKKVPTSPSTGIKKVPTPPRSRTSKRQPWKGSWIASPTI